MELCNSREGILEDLLNILCANTHVCKDLVHVLFFFFFLFLSSSSIFTGDALKRHRFSEFGSRRRDVFKCTLHSR